MVLRVNEVEAGSSKAVPGRFLTLMTIKHSKAWFPLEPYSVGRGSTGAFPLPTGVHSFPKKTPRPRVPSVWSTFPKNVGNILRSADWTIDDPYFERKQEAKGETFNGNIYPINCGLFLC